MYVLIVNPKSGNGRGMKVYETLKGDPIFSKNQCRTFFTEYEGHATDLTEQITHMYLEKIKGLIVIGGDGTFHEVVNGLKKLPSIKIAFIPAGSGNDFARGCNLTKKGLPLFRQILSSPSWKPYWFGKVTKRTTGKEQKLLFANSIGFGFDAEVAKKSNEASSKKIVNKLKLGSLIYVIALIQVLFSFRVKNIEVTIDGKKKEFSRAWMVTITNHPYFGGGMKIVPQAKINEDYLYGLIIHDISKWKVLFLFFTVFLGKHTKFKEVYTFQARNIKLNVKKGIDYQIDGQTGFCHECEVEKDSLKRTVNRF